MLNIEASGRSDLIATDFMGRVAGQFGYSGVPSIVNAVRNAQQSSAIAASAMKALAVGTVHDEVADPFEAVTWTRNMCAMDTGGRIHDAADVPIRAPRECKSSRDRV